MFAKEFFSKVEQCLNAGCSAVKIRIEGSPTMRLRHYKDGHGCISVPEELLFFRDLYPLLETYMYARFVTPDEIELVDSSQRELHQLVIENVSQDGEAVAISARFVGTE